MTPSGKKLPGYPPSGLLRAVFLCRNGGKKLFSKKFEKMRILNVVLILTGYTVATTKKEAPPGTRRPPDKRQKGCDPMKKTITAILALTLSAALFTGCTAAAMNAGDNTASGVAPAGSPTSSVSAGIAGNAGSETYIDQSDAESIALTDAGLTSDTVKSLRSRLEYDDGVAIYDVEFWTDTDEYDYEIDAVSGEILAVDRDVEGYTPSATAASDATTSGVAPQGDPITEDAARQAALTHAGLTDDGSIQYYRCELDRDDGQCHYDVEFCHNGTEYDYEIDAYTGEVHSYDHETEYHHHQYGSGQGNAYGNGYGGSTSATSATITADEAKAIAFQHAGVNEADATRVKVDLDEDDGRLEYEVEWEIGTTEYDVTVDATDGSVISYEVDN